MEDFIDVLTLLALLGFWGFVHSFLASLKVKEFFKKQFGKAISFYRLCYNLFSIVTLYLIWEYSPHPSTKIYQLNPPFDFLVLIPQMLSLLGIIWCFRFISSKEFLGLAQIERFLNKEYSEEELDEKMTFRIEGPYKYSRHPIYFFSIVFLLFRAEMDLFYLTVLIVFIAYFYIGSVYEEKKLVTIFGDDYREYQKKVPRIFPVKLFTKNG
ncbi:MAG: isoprenylcysteine carboxylmethyltransferase family protein [Ignavibacterium album]|jgi:protein-S-isoprenylcysteine O-methyltransferase Ste14|uniref:methyltransferase family protein n=1 Tax=Ignavibacterium album TaxID=591197 RepID=UPI0026F07193|nr:isoprenylcysteine carboxylmethyltransferase family protein [Ignavibacterium album]MCX8106873.1 isoprenylcysteine carboxylmethyltransferase family protein [Ignavibacterium album]